MTSNIALDKIIKFYDEDNYKDGIKYLFDGELEIIKKDLEVLELIKTKVFSYVKIKDTTSWMCDGFDRLTLEEQQKLIDFLEEK